jgi:hypothetical protein
VDACRCCSGKCLILGNCRSPGSTSGVVAPLWNHTHTRWARGEGPDRPGRLSRFGRPIDRRSPAAATTSYRRGAVLYHCSRPQPGQVRDSVCTLATSSPREAMSCSPGMSPQFPNACCQRYTTLSTHRLDVTGCGCCHASSLSSRRTRTGWCAQGYLRCDC